VTIFVTRDLALFPEMSPEGSQTVWIAMNVFTRTCLAIDARGVERLSSFACGESGTHEAKLGSTEKFTVWEIARFSNEDGLLADPSRFIRDSKTWKTPLTLNDDQFVQILKKHFILIDDATKYKSFFGRKSSILDSRHLGNLHDQIGSFVTLSKRTSPSDWWVEQKFRADYSSTKDDSLYTAVEKNYLTGYFRKKLSGQLRALDLGCGIGYFSSLMAETGVEVTGLDPNSSYIEIAKTKFGHSATFEVSKIGQEGDLSRFADESFDFIFMSDALLFYFVPISEKDKQSLGVLFKDIKRLLKPNGIFSSVESHPFFYQAPWLGDLNAPFTIKTEYRNKKTGVVPTFSEMGRAFTENGFVISWMDELYSTTPYTGHERDFNFAKEFPLWVLFELKKREENGKSISN